MAYGSMSSISHPRRWLTRCRRHSRRSSCIAQSVIATLSVLKEQDTNHKVSSDTLTQARRCMVHVGVQGWFLIATFKIISPVHLVYNK